MTTFPDLPDAEKIAAMRARAKTEAEQYGQTTTPAMLLQGAAWGEEVVRLRDVLREIRGHCQNSGIEIATVGERVMERCEDAARAALEGPK